MHGARAERYLYLFEKVLLIGKKREDGLISVKTHITVSTPEITMRVRYILLPVRSISRENILISKIKSSQFYLKVHLSQKNVFGGRIKHPGKLFCLLLRKLQMNSNL